ncbi:hypothetical protein RvY_02849 [Ramazzottius varieornatus]|uniref:Uncharacterized protein n=1 Tax=Ramazzottius varieornatus TaxID=947166 RepID=A0A1D1UL56_RAMVA|nr:hypothetical protein RvY_02849 [Ramazzottius varieornatus]
MSLIVSESTECGNDCCLRIQRVFESQHGHLMRAFRKECVKIRKTMERIQTEKDIDPITKTTIGTLMLEISETCIQLPPAYRNMGRLMTDHLRTTKCRYKNSKDAITRLTKTWETEIVSKTMKDA